MNFRGERFHIPLDDDNGGEDEYDAFERSAVDATTAQPAPAAPSLAGCVKDIQEHNPTSQKTPVAPSLKEVTQGFPAHRKRTGASMFKKARSDQSIGTGGNPAVSKPVIRAPHAADPMISFEDRETAAIDRENKSRLAKMSDEDIATERADLLKGLSPGLLQKLLRANIDTDTGPDDFPDPASAHVTREDETAATDLSQDSALHLGKPSAKRVTFMSPSEDTSADSTPARPSEGTTHTTQDEEAIKSTQSPPEQHPHAVQTSGSIHFPHPPSAPNLDPTSASFLTDLHTKYFPNLPSDPSKLAWMTEPSTQPTYAPSYSPEADSLPASSVRFSFTGTLIPPRSALAIPVTQGLHHHGDAPESAGYTIPELAHLARSAFPAQRCVAFQTLGRVMYRLGSGEFGDREEDLAGGLWKCLEEGRVLATLREWSERVGGHQSSKAYATEALWLWQKGGGHRVKAK